MRSKKAWLVILVTLTEKTCNSLTLLARISQPHPPLSLRPEQYLSPRPPTTTTSVHVYQHPVAACKQRYPIPQLHRLTNPMVCPPCRLNPLAQSVCNLVHLLVSEPGHHPRFLRLEAERRRSGIVIKLGTDNRRLIGPVSILAELQK